MTLLVTAEAVAGRLGLALPLAAATQARIETAIQDSQDKVESFLRRPLVATERTLTGIWPTDGLDLTDWRAWPDARRYIDDRYRVKSYVANTADPELFDVTFTVGLDVAGDPELHPILGFIAKDAAADLRTDPLFKDVERAVNSVSAGGQSITYEKAPTDPTAAGAPPKIDGLKRWRRHAIYQPPMQPLQPWPYAYRD